MLPTKKICLKDRVALITGAGSGIGRELALSLAQLGVHLILLDIRKDAIDAVSAEIIQRQETEEKDPVTAVINKEAGLRNRQPSASAPRSTSTSTRAGVTVKVLTYECDISLPDMIDRTNELIANDLQRLNLPPVSLLINNAGRSFLLLAFQTLSDHRWVLLYEHRFLYPPTRAAVTRNHRFVFTHVDALLYIYMQALSLVHRCGRKRTPRSSALWMSTSSLTFTSSRRICHTCWVATMAASSPSAV